MIRMSPVSLRRLVRIAAPALAVLLSLTGTARAQGDTSGQTRPPRDTMQPAGTAPSGGPAPSIAPPGGAAPSGGTVAGGAPTTTTTAPIATTPDTLRLNVARPARGPVRGAFKGHTIALDLSHPLRGDTPIVVLTYTDSTGRSLDAGLQLPVYAIKDSTIFVRVPDTIASGRYQVIAYAGGKGGRRMLEYPQPLVVQSIWYAVGMACLPVGLLVLFVILVGSQTRTALGAERSGGQKRVSILRLFLVDPRNETVSLSRLQFLFWTFILAFSYCFLFVARVVAENVWAYPSLDGFATTFFISLGTLLGSEATTQVKGPSGAGSVVPRVSDLFMHGGVVAPERVQQILWTLVTAVMFLLIVINNYAISAAIPEIPDELLVLMGISSAGYLTGKMIRKSGPVLSGVAPDLTNGTLTLEGDNISADAKVYVDGKLLGEPMSTEPDPTKPGAMMKSMTFNLSNDMPMLAKLQSGRTSVWVVNADGQRAQGKLGVTGGPVVPPANAGGGAGGGGGAQGGGGAAQGGAAQGGGIQGGGAPPPPATDPAAQGGAPGSDTEPPPSGQ